MSITLLSLTSPCLRYCSIVAQSTLNVLFTVVNYLMNTQQCLLTASPHHCFSPSLSALKYASTTSGIMYSRNSLENDSRLKSGSIIRITRVTCAVSVSSNQPPMVLVTDRMLETTGFSDSSYAARQDVNVRKMGFVCFSWSHFSYLSESLCRTIAAPALFDQSCQENS